MPLVTSSAVGVLIFATTAVPSIRTASVFVPPTSISIRTAIRRAPSFACEQPSRPCSLLRLDGSGGMCRGGSFQVIDEPDSVSVGDKGCTLDRPADVNRGCRRRDLHAWRVLDL